MEAKHNKKASKMFFFMRFCIIIYCIKSNPLATSLTEEGKPRINFEPFTSVYNTNKSNIFTWDNKSAWKLLCERARRLVKQNTCLFQFSAAVQIPIREKRARTSLLSTEDINIYIQHGISLAQKSHRSTSALNFSPRGAGVCRFPVSHAGWAGCLTARVFHFYLYL